MVPFFAAGMILCFQFMISSLRGSSPVSCRADGPIDDVRQIAYVFIGLVILYGVNSFAGALANCKLPLDCSLLPWRFA
jgi:hypothetical protein